MNAYTTLETLKSRAVLDIRDASQDAQLLSLIERVSRQIDDHCRRHFYILRNTRLFDGGGADWLRVPDLVSIDRDGLATDDDRDREFETLWNDSDYLLHPVNADPTGGHDTARPYSSVRVDRVAGSKQRFPSGARTVRIAGEWGFWRRLRPVSSTLTSDLDADRIELPVESSPGIEVGHTLFMGTEQIYVSGASGQTLSVRRGVNGTAAEDHETGVAISIFEYPGPISEAAVLQAARFWRQRGGSSAQSASLAEDVRQLMAPYRRLTV